MSSAPLGHLAIYSRTVAESLRDYAIFCGAAYLLFHLVLRRLLAARKITPKPTPARAPLLEIGRTIVSNLLGKGPLLVGLAYLTQQHVVPQRLLYARLDEHAWAYFALTIAVDVLVFDLWFYLSHRFWLHSRFGYRHIHIVHHRSVDPTPFARNAVHPIEGIGNAIFHILPIFLIPHHPLAILISVQLKGLVGIWSHLGYEIFPSGFSRHWLGRYVVTPVHHHLHHAKNVRSNFSFLINYDLLFGTQSGDYHVTFEQTVTRGRKQAAAARAELEAASAAPAQTLSQARAPSAAQVPTSLPPSEAL